MIRNGNILLKIIFSLAFVFIFLGAKTQDMVYFKSNAGFNVSANFALGTHFQRLGINFNFFYTNKNFQSNTEVRTYFNMKNLGPEKKHLELVLSQGVVFGYGSQTNFFNPFINSVSNQTGYSNSLAYSYNAYFNKVNTTQQTGIVAIQISSLSLITENDILARPLLDRYRTGAFLIQYQYADQFQAGVNCTMWTGWMGKCIRGDTCYPSAGYIDTTGATYARYSHGLLSAQFKYNIGLTQNVQANIGVDAEQVRNAMQNKFIHDAVFLPKSWFKRYNLHIPMLDENSGQYLYRPGQKVRKPRLYWDVFSNANLFY